jgi:hypothetical protein
MWIVKLILFILPFLKEIILADKTWKQAFRTHRVRLMVLIVLVLSIGLNLFVMDRFMKHAKNQSAITAVKCQPESTPPKPKETVGAPPNPPKADPSDLTSDAVDRYRRLKEQFERLNKREANEERLVLSALNNSN